jgi:hypothetical protein
MSGFGMEGVCLRPTIGLQITMSIMVLGKEC